MYCKGTFIESIWLMWHEFHCTLHNDETADYIRTLSRLCIKKYNCSCLFTWYIDSFSQSRLLCTLCLDFMKHKEQAIRWGSISLHPFPYFPLKTPNFGAWIGIFKPKTFILSKLLHRFQPNFAVMKTTKCPSCVVPTHALQIQDGGRPLSEYFPYSYIWFTGQAKSTCPLSFLLLLLRRLLDVTMTFHCHSWREPWVMTAQHWWDAVRARLSD